MKKCFIVKNCFKGWKVVRYGKSVDCSEPVFDSQDTSEYGLNLCRKFCKDNELLVIRECK